MGGDVTFHLATVATPDACGKLPLCVAFDARRGCTGASVTVDSECACVMEGDSVSVMDR